MIKKSAWQVPNDVALCSTLSASSLVKKKKRKELTEKLVHKFCPSRFRDLRVEAGAADWFAILMTGNRLPATGNTRAGRAPPAVAGATVRDYVMESDN